MGNEQSMSAKNVESEYGNNANIFLIHQAFDKIFDETETMMDDAKKNADNLVVELQDLLACRPKSMSATAPLGTAPLDANEMVAFANSHEGGEWLLHKAASSGHIRILETVVAQKKISLNCTDDQGNTALHKAAWSGRLEAVRFLVKHGAEMHVINDKGHTPLSFATNRGHKEISSHLKEMMRHQSPQDVKSRFRSQIKPSNSAEIFGPRQSTEALSAATTPAISRTSSTSTESRYSTVAQAQTPQSLQTEQCAKMPPSMSSVQKRQPTFGVWAEADLIRLQPGYTMHAPVEKCVQSASGHFGPLIPVGGISME